MAYGRSYTTWRYRSRYGTRSTRRWNNGFRRRATGNSRSARQQRDAATVTISRIATVPVTISSGQSNGAVSINHWDQLRQSTYFPNYSPMYDQMKIDKIRIKITGNQSGSAVTANLSPAVVAAFDRNGLSPSQQITTAAISTYSSAQLKQWSTGNAFVMWQSIYPSTIMEKGQYIPTDSLQDPDTVTSTVNPCVNESDPTLPFKPITLLGVDMGSSMSSAQTFAFTVEYEYTVTFRGMRKPSLAYADYDIYGFRVFQRVGDIITRVSDVNINEFTYAASGITISIASKGLLIRMYPRNYTIEGMFVAGLTYRFNGSNVTTTYEVPAGSYYRYVRPPFTGTNIDYALVAPLVGTSFQDSDPTYISSFNYVSTSVSDVTVNIDSEDLPDGWWR